MHPQLISALSDPEGIWGSYGLWHFDWFDHGLLNSLLSRWQYTGNAVGSWNLLSEWTGL